MSKRAKGGHGLPQGNVDMKKESAMRLERVRYCLGQGSGRFVMLFCLLTIFIQSVSGKR